MLRVPVRPDISIPAQILIVLVIPDAVQIPVVPIISVDRHGYAIFPVGFIQIDPIPVQISTISVVLDAT